MRVLVLSRVYPNAAQPTHGIFVHERVRRVAAGCALEVVAPLARFPGDAIAGRIQRDRVPRLERRDDIAVHHPSFVSIPGVAKSFDGVLYALSLLPFLRRLRRRFPFDLIDAHFGYPDGVAAALLGRALGCPVAVTLRGNEVSLLRHPWRRRQLRVALEHATVIAVSESVAACAVRLGIAREGVRVIPNGIDAGTFHPGDRDGARASLGLPPHRPIVLSVGAFVERKGHERVLASLPALLAKRPELLFVVVGNAGGSDDRLAAIRRQVARMGVEGHVQLAVSRPHEEIATWLRAADLFCLATAREGWANAISEALACGLPVVTTRVGGNAEIVRDGLDGHLVPFFDAAAFVTAIERGLDTRWDRAAIAARAARRSWEQVADEVMESFEATLARARP